MTRHPWRRVAAWVIDCGLICAYAGVLAAIVVPLSLAGVVGELPQALGNLVAALVLVVPVVLVLAGLESGPRAATVGKRVVRLRVAGVAGARIGYGQAVARNAVKVALPWLIGHAAVYALWNGSAQGAVPGWAWPLLALGYVLPIVWVVTLFVRSGRTPYDCLARTTVVRL